jgi:hypothetical protein
MLALALALVVELIVRPREWASIALGSPAR